MIHQTLRGGIAVHHGQADLQVGHPHQTVGVASDIADRYKGLGGADAVQHRVGVVYPPPGAGAVEHVDAPTPVADPQMATGIGLYVGHRLRRETGSEIVHSPALAVELVETEGGKVVLGHGGDPQVAIVGEFHVEEVVGHRLARGRRRRCADDFEPVLGANPEGGIHPGDGAYIADPGKALGLPVVLSAALVEGAAGGDADQSAFEVAQSDDIGVAKIRPGPARFCVEAPDGAPGSAVQCIIEDVEILHPARQSVGSPAIRVLQVGQFQVGPGDTSGGARPQLVLEYQQIEHFDILGHAAQLAVVLLDLLFVDQEDADTAIGAHEEAVPDGGQDVDIELFEIEEGWIDAAAGRTQTAQPLVVGAEPQISPEINCQAGNLIAGQTIEPGEAVVAPGLLIKAQHPSRADGPDNVLMNQKFLDTAHAGVGGPLVALLGPDPGRGGQQQCDSGDAVEDRHSVQRG